MAPMAPNNAPRHSTGSFLQYERTSYSQAENTSLVSGSGLLTESTLSPRVCHELTGDDFSFFQGVTLGFSLAFLGNSVAAKSQGL